ncbi:MAG: branched-chain amino acid ABC transporter permease [Spirochaetaceae bacterium]|nr:branched-chain amino acid ABC transporter permease [Spirochaetaceae bacterium]
MLLAISLFPVFLKNNYYLTIGCQAMLYCIVALGLNFIVGMSGMMTLGTGAVYGLGAYTSALLSTKLGVNPWLALIPVLVMGWLIGKGLGFPSLRVQFVYFSLVTIAFNEIVRNLLTNLEFTGSGTGVRNIPPYSIFGFEFNTQLRSYYLIFAFLVVFIIIALRIAKSKWRRAFIAVKDNPEALEVSGINVSSVKITAFTLSSIFGCVAGALYAHFNRYITPSTFTTDLSISFVVMLIIGGLGNFWGCILGAYVVAFLPQLLRSAGTSYKLIYAVLMMLAVILFPNGIMSDIRRSVGKLINNGKGFSKGGGIGENRTGN